MGTRAKARKKVTTVTEEIPEGAPLEGEETLSEFDIQLEQAQDIDALNDVLDEYGIEREGRLFRIYKILPNGKPSFCYEDPKLDYTFVQQQRGEGSYIARLHINGKWKRNIEFSCEPPISTNGNGKPNGASNHEQFLEKLLMVLITNQVSGSHAAGPSLKDITDTIVNIDAMRGKQESAVDLLMKGMEMADRFGGGGGSKDWKTELLSMGREALPAITAVVQSGLTARNGNPPPPQPTNLTPEQQVEQMKFALLSAIGMLKKQFMGGLDVDSAINLVLANAGNPMYQPVIQQFVSCTWEDLVQLDADLSKEPIGSKFRAFYDGLRSELIDEDSVESDTGRDSGDVADIRDHGGSRKTGK